MELIEYIITTLPIFLLLLVVNHFCEQQKNRYLIISCILSIGALSAEIYKFMLPALFVNRLFNNQRNQIQDFIGIMNEIKSLMFVVAFIFLYIGIRINKKRISNHELQVMSSLRSEHHLLSGVLTPNLGRSIII